MNFFKRHLQTFKTYAKACSICSVIFMTCAIVTDELGAWLVAFFLVFATIIISLIVQFTEDFSCDNAKVKTKVKES